MKLVKTILLIVITIVFVSASIDSQNKYILMNDYTVTIKGTSNLHDWNEKVQIVSGNGAVTQNADGSFNLDGISIRMKVNSIKSGEGSIMDNKTYSALKADSYPEIIFTLTAPVKSISSSAEKIIFAKGNLTIAGVTKSVDMQVKVWMKESGKLTFQGAQIIKMSDYNISPPSALFGTLKTGNELTIDFKTNFTITK